MVNPTTYKRQTFTWGQGRKLMSGTMNGKNFTYSYEGNGMRYKKVVNGVTTEYYYNGTQLLVESRNGKRLYYIYGKTGIEGLIRENENYTNEYYYFDKNTLGDIVAIRDQDGEIVAKYEYDAWGNVTVMNGNGSLVISDNSIGNINPFRYRGYYYDTETGFYYLQTRYYDPEICRFISADDYELIATLSEVPGQLNLYAYCNNNPIMFTDPNGCMPNWLKWVIGGVVILGLGIATIATGGAAAGAAGFIVASAFKGAVIGAVSGALVSGTIGGISAARSNDGFWNGFADGAASGFMSGAIIGGIAGAVSSSVQVANAAKSWVATGGKSGFKQMTQHYTRHVINEGQKSVAKNIVNYTKQAKVFFANNNASGYLLREGVIKIAGAPGGIFNTNGLIRSFWYVLL